MRRSHSIGMNISGNCNGGGGATPAGRRRQNGIFLGGGFRLQRVFELIFLGGAHLASCRPREGIFWGELTSSQLVTTKSQLELVLHAALATFDTIGVTHSPQPDYVQAKDSTSCATMVEQMRAWLYYEHLLRRQAQFDKPVI